MLFGRFFNALRRRYVQKRAAFNMGTAENKSRGEHTQSEEVRLKLG